MSTRFGWFEKEFRLNFPIRPSGLCLALAYAVVFWLARQISVDQWMLSAGVRVGALLLFAPRYWPYLILGEYAVFAYTRAPLINTFGPAWAIVSSIVLMPAAAYIVHRHRRLLASGKHYWILSVAVLSAIVITALNLSTAWLLMPTRHEAVSWNGAIKYMIGDYLGILIFAPLVVLWTQRQLSFPSARRIPLDALISIAVIVLLGVIAMQLPETAGFERNSLRLLMVVPAAALTYLHGWRGAVIGVASLTTIVGLTTQSTGEPNSFDANAFLAQEILAITNTALLFFGAAISHYYRKFKHRDLMSKHAVAAARINLITGDRALFDRVVRMEIISDDIDTILRNAVKTMREEGLSKAAIALQNASVPQMQLFREQLLLTYPSGIGRYGLYVALHSCVFAGVWEQTGRLTRPRLLGDPCQLSVELQVTAYRGICDAIRVLMDHETGTIDVRARCWRHRAHRGIVINVSLLDHTRSLAPATAVQALELLMGRALAFDGTVRCRRNRIRLLFSERAEATVAYRVPSGASIDQMTPPAVS